MKSVTTRRFREAYARLPESIRKHAKRAYGQFKENPQHPSLRLKQVHTAEPIVSVRITAAYRALGVRDSDTVVWFWIGNHSEYERLIKEL